MHIVDTQKIYTEWGDQPSIYTEVASQQIVDGHVFILNKSECSPFVLTRDNINK